MKPYLGPFTPRMAIEASASSIADLAFALEAGLCNDLSFSTWNCTFRLGRGRSGVVIEARGCYGCRKGQEAAILIYR